MQDKPFLSGLWSNDETCSLFVWNVFLKKLIHKNKCSFEREKDQFTCDPSKLIIENTFNSNLLFMRGCYNKGIEIISLDDGSMVDKIEKMHLQPINQILIKRDRVSNEQ